MPKTLDYAVVDVFAEHALEGNPLAIFTDARGLTDAEMQALARETNLAETTFILPGDVEEERQHGVRIRIFTTEEELPFAGHPTLGTATWLLLNHPELRGQQSVTLRLNVGPVTVRFDEQSDGQPGLEGVMLQPEPVFGAIHDAAEVARVIGLEPGDLDSKLPVQTVSTGMPFVIVPVASLEAIGRLEIPQAQARRWLDGAGAKFFFCMTPAAAGSGADFHNRMQFYNGEDPATGSASGCAIAYLVQHGVVPAGQWVTFEQGLEIRRPSKIRVRASLSDGKVHEVFVGGRTIPVASGRFLLP